MRLGLRLRPYKLLLELTYDCNSRCGYCAIWKTPHGKKKHEIGLSDIERLFRASGTDIAWLALSGGEITIYEDFAPVIALAKKYCPALRILTFTTNGLLPEKAVEIAGCARDAGFDTFVTVSLDGDEETHDRLRGIPGNHALAWRTYRLLKSNGFTAHFGLTLSEKNERFVHERYRELRDEIKAVTFVHGGGIYGQATRVDVHAIARSVRTILREYRVASPGEFVEKVYLKLALVFFDHGRSKNVVPCGVGHTSLHARPDGSVGHCMFMPALGNLKSETLDQIVNSSGSKAMLGEIARGNCPRCWINCYAPHSMLLRPLKTLLACLPKSRISTWDPASTR